MPFRPGAKGERKKERATERKEVVLLCSPARWSGHHGCVVPARRCFDMMLVCLCAFVQCPPVFYVYVSINVPASLQSGIICSSVCCIDLGIPLKYIIYTKRGSFLFTIYSIICQMLELFQGIIQDKKPLSGLESRTRIITLELILYGHTGTQQ